MPIREKGYYNWEGELKTSHVKWLPILFNGIKTVYKKKWSKLVFFLCGFMFLLFRKNGDGASKRQNVFEN